MQWGNIQPSKKKEILLFVTTQMNLEGTCLMKQDRQRKANTAWSHFYVKSKKVKLIKEEGRMVFARN